MTWDLLLPPFLRCSTFNVVVVLATVRSRAKTFTFTFSYSCTWLCRIPFYYCIIVVRTYIPPTWNMRCNSSGTQREKMLHSHLLFILLPYSNRILTYRKVFHCLFLTLAILSGNLIFFIEMFQTQESNLSPYFAWVSHLQYQHKDHHKTPNIFHPPRFGLPHRSPLRDHKVQTPDK